MAFKLSKADVRLKDGIVADLSERSENLSTAITAYNAAIREVSDGLKEALEAYNNTLFAARELIGSVIDDEQEAFNNRSDRWRDSEAGHAADAFLSAWINLNGEFEDIDFEEPEEFDEPDLSHSGDLSDAPDAAE